MNRQDAKSAKRDGRIEPAERLDRLAYAIIGAALEVHKALGPGFLESVYEEALCVELELRGIPFVRQAAVSVAYKGHAVGEGKVDLLVDDAIVVELKAVEALASIHDAQVISYLKATGFHLGLLNNFNARALKDGLKRLVNS